MDMQKAKNAFILMQIENWESLQNTLSPFELAIFESQFSDFVSMKFGDSFRSLIISSGDFFIIVDNLKEDKSILRFSGELKHQFNIGTNFFPKKLEVSIALTTKSKDMEAYDILLYLRNILQICRSEKQSDILCVA